MRNKSFTLIELLVVIVIIGVLAGVIMITTSSSVSNATLARAKAFSSNVQNSMLLNLISEWTFDEGDANDSWGVNDGTIYGADPETDCVFGGCYSFDGVDDYIQIADNQEMRMTTGGTIAAWIYPRTWGESGYGRLIDKSEGLDGENGYIIYFNGSSLRFKANAGVATISPNNLITLNQWNFVIIGFNIYGRQIYINGAEATLTGGNATELPSNVVGIVRIGNRAGATDRTFDGLIDDVRIYDSILSSSQLKQNYIVGLNSLLGKGVISEGEYNQRIEELASK